VTADAARNTSRREIAIAHPPEFAVKET
jgi:hypothetical protein